MSRRARILSVIAGGAGLLAVAFFLGGREALLAVLAWIRGAGPTGPILYGLLYVAATVLLIPASLLTLGAGVLYGPARGTLVVCTASLLGATAAFLLGRSMARAWVTRRLERDPRLSAVRRAIRGDAFRITLLLRLSPVVPFNLLNYALGVTDIGLREYLSASFLGMLPGTLLYVYLGSLIPTLADLVSGRRPRGGPWTGILSAAGAVFTLLAVILIARAARRSLQPSLTPLETSARVQEPAP